MRGEHVGVDVQQRAVRVDADAGDDRDVAEPSRSRKQRASVPSGSPTRPRSASSPATVRSGAARRERPIRPSAPVRPTARPPAAPIAATSAVLVRPASTETTVSSVAASVTRRPSTKRGRLAARAQLGVDRPAAAVDDDERPDAARRTIAAAAERDRRGVLEQLAAEFEDRRIEIVQFSPIVSSKPNATLKFWIAWPAAPFTRLSMHDDHHELPAGLVDAPADVAEVRVRDVLDLGQIRPVSRTNGESA